MPKLYIITGIAGAGKSTLARKMIEEGKASEFCEADHEMVDKKGNYLFDPKRLGYCHTTCQQRVENCMRLESDVIVSNTTLTKKEARPYIEMANLYVYEVEIIHLTTEFKSIHEVPLATLQYMKARREFFTLEDFN